MYRLLSGRTVIVCVVTAILVACGGSDGTDGATGAQGAAGTPGAQGPAGANGLAALVTDTAEAAGANCAHGGNRVDSGLDSNRNSALDAGEITGTQYVCNGAPGAAGAPGVPGLPGVSIQSLVETRAEPAGANCAAGGQQFSAGLDTNDNGALEAGEINSSGYVCNGAAGAAGAAGTSGINSLTATTAEPAGANCANGGVRLTTGEDANSNGALEVAEISATRFVCNGANGTNGTNGANGTNGSNGISTLIRMDAEVAGLNCAYGGTRISAGADANSNTVLDNGEVTASAYACNGAPGPGITWSTVSGASVQAIGNRGYLINNPTEEVVITLPASPAIGEQIQINGIGAGGWRIEQNVGQQTVLTPHLAGPLSDTWSVHAFVQDWTAINMSASGRRMAATIMNGPIYYSSDYGSTWHVSDSPSLTWNSLTPSADGLRMYAFGIQGGYVSTNGGANWTSLAVPWNINTPRAAVSADGTRLVVAMYIEPLYVSADGGAHWNTVEQARIWADVASSASGQIVVAADSSSDRLYVSEDFGVTWAPRGPAFDWARISCALDCAQILAADSSETLHLSHDGGLTFTPVAGATGVFVTSSANGRRLAASSYAGNLFVSDDAGVTWTEHSSLHDVMSLASSADGFRIAAVHTGQDIQVSNREPLEATTAGTVGRIVGGQYSSVTLIYTGANQFLLTDSVGLLDAR